MSLPLDLSITGKATPRAPKEPTRRPLSANRTRNTKSNIFGVDERLSPSRAQRKQSDPGLPPKPNVISKTQYESIQSLKTTTTDQALFAEHSPKEFRRSNTRKAPEGVPKLQLQGVIDRDDKSERSYVVQKPDVGVSTAKPRSWISPQTSARRPPSGKQPKGGGWQVNQSRKPARSPLSSGRKKHEDVPTLDLQLSQSNEGLTELARAAKMVRDELNIEYIGVAKYQQARATENPKVKENEERFKKERENEKEKEVQALRETEKKISETENHTEGNNTEDIFPSEKTHQSNKKAEFVEQALLLDQLARVAMEEKDFAEEEKSYQNGMPDPKARRHMDLFQTNLFSATSPSKTSLVKRLRFGARILSRNGHDALREINGFFFPTDNTLTMYEFRQFGTRSSALPFIQRGCYPRGPKEEEPYNLADIDVGKTLHFSTKCHTSLPANLIANPVISFRITDVDKASRDDLLYEGCRTAKERAERDKSTKSYSSSADRATQAYLEQIQVCLQEKIRKRATKTITNIGKHFRKLEKATEKSLELEDLKTALKVYRVELRDEDLENAWQLVNEGAVKPVDYVDIMHALIGEMSEPRKALVRKAFIRLDPSKSGQVTTAVIKKFFNARKHPLVVEGVTTEANIIAEFLSHFDGMNKDGEITFKEFEEYYEGESIDCQSNQEFALIMKNTWGVVN